MQGHLSKKNEQWNRKEICDPECANEPVNLKVKNLES